MSTTRIGTHRALEDPRVGLFSQRFYFHDPSIEKGRKKASKKWAKNQDPDNSANDILSQTACTVKSTCLFSDDSDSDNEFEPMSNSNIKVRVVNLEKKPAFEQKQVFLAPETTLNRSSRQAGSSIMGMLLKKRNKDKLAVAANEEDSIC